MKYWTIATVVLVTAPLSLSQYINNSMYPICTQPVFMQGNSNPDIFNTLYNCIANITDALEPPSYFKNAIPVTTMQSYQFNNMIALSELEGTAALDMFWRIYWQDPRMNMP